MNVRSLSLLALATLALTITGCGQKEPKAALVPSSEFDAEEYFGTYTGRRIDEPDSATPPSVEELIGSSTLTLHEGGSKFTMSHNGVVLAGEYEYLDETGENGVTFKIMQMDVQRIGIVTEADIEDVDLEANKEAGIKPSTQEALDKYTRIFDDTIWRFEVTEDGFYQLDSAFVPAMYVFTRDDDRIPMDENAGTPQDSNMTPPPGGLG